MHKVFLSSTWRDMADRRAAILRAIRLLDRFDVEAMEDLEVCLKKLPEYDVFFGVLRGAYGSLPPAGDPSYTEREYEEARSDAGQRRGPRNHPLFRAKLPSRSQPNWRAVKAVT